MRNAACVAGALAAALVLGCGGGVGTQAPEGGGVAAAPAKAKPRTRDELKQLLAGKTKDEVLKALGKPERTLEFESGDCWVYMGISYDTVAEKIDRATSIWFTPTGIVEDVRF